MELWFKEVETNDLHICFRVCNVLHREQSEYQDIAILDTPTFGRMLVLDGIVQTTVEDEFFYHEMIAHVPLFAHPQPRRVLVIGGGDGGTVREVLKHESVEQVDLVEIDGRVIELSRQYLPELSHALDDTRVNIFVADGLQYVQDVRDAYDVAIIDSSDPTGAAVGLFQEKFYRDVACALRKDGLMAAQTESPWLTPDLVPDIVGAIGNAFDSRAYVYLTSVPIYSLGQWSFTIGTKYYDPRRPHLPLDEMPPFATRYYTSEIHAAAFALPRSTRKLLGLVT